MKYLSIVHNMVTPSQPLRNILPVNREAKNRLNHTYTKDLDFYVIINSFFLLKNAGKLNSLSCTDSLNLINFFHGGSYLHIILFILLAVIVLAWLYQMFSLKIDYKG